MKVRYIFNDNRSMNPIPCRKIRNLNDLTIWWKTFNKCENSDFFENIYN